MISLKNKNVAELVEFKLDKLENSFSEEELNKITDLVYDVITVNDELIEDDLSDLKYFKNLKKLYLMNMSIEKENARNIFILPAIEDLSFDKVDFLYTDFISNLNVKKIAFINTSLENFSFIKEMNKSEKIEIVGAKEIALSYFENMISLKELILEHTNITDRENLWKFSHLEGFSINDTNIENLSFFEKFDNLKYVGLDRKQIDNNKEIIEKLREKNVSIFIDNLIEY